MGNRGRPPKPLSLHIAEGTLREDRHGSKDDIPHPEGKPKRPSKMKKDAAWLWDNHVAKLVESGVATAIDAPQLWRMCDCWHELRRCWAELEKTQPVEKDYYRYLLQSQMLEKMFDSIASRFGLTASDRMRIKITNTESKSVGVRSRKRG